MADTFTIDPDEIVKVPGNFVAFLAQQGTTISSASYIVPSILTAASQTNTTTTTSALISTTTTTETSYKCAIRVLLADGQTRELPFTIKVKSNNEG